MNLKSRVSIVTERRFSLGFIGVWMCLLSACSWHSFTTAFHPTVGDKWSAELRSQQHWGRESSMAEYGYSRSLQLLETKGFTMSKAGGAYEGGTGLAAIISADGYALTANHVLDRSRQLGVIGIPKSAQRLHLISVRKKGASGMMGEKGITALPFPDIKKLALAERRRVSIKKVRVVHLFAEQDLALIKLPSSQAPFFKIGEMPSLGDWVFASGNGISAAPFSTAGQVLRATGKKGRFLARMPSALGDSGGPVLDAQGRLVGIFSKLTPEGTGRLQGLRWFQSSCCEVPNKAKIAELISTDRSSFR